MRMATKVVLGTAFLAALTLFVGAVAYAGTGDVLGTKHNTGSPGNPACNVCHTPHDAKGSYLWARSVGAGAGLKPLCYSCHDGSVTKKVDVAFDATKVQHPATAGTKGQDCDRCHDSHAKTYMFTTLSNLGANMCSSCHGKTGSVNHPIDVVDANALPTARAFDPSLNITGTVLFDQAGSVVVTSGSGYIKCLTCHASHGTVNDKLTTMATTSAADASSPLCQNCHK